MHSVIKERFFLCTHPKKSSCSLRSLRNFFGFVQRKNLSSITSCIWILYLRRKINDREVLWSISSISRGQNSDTRVFFNPFPVSGLVLGGTTSKLLTKEERVTCNQNWPSIHVSEKKNTKMVAQRPISDILRKIGR